MKTKEVLFTVVLVLIVSGFLIWKQTSTGIIKLDAQTNIIQTGGVTTIKLSSLQNGDYTPKSVNVKLGTKVRIEADVSTLTGSMGKLIIDGYELSKDIIPGDNVLEFIADKPGQFRMHCANNMGNGTLIVK